MGRHEHVRRCPSHLSSPVTIPSRTNRLIWFLPISSGILYAVGFPRLDFSIAAWISLVPLLIAIQKVSPRRALTMGWVAGSLAFLLILYWTTISMHQYGGLPLPITIPPLLMLVTYIGLYFAGFCYLFIWIRSKIRIPSVILAPVIWTTLEWIRAHALTGLPWGLLGYSQYQNLPMIQIADLTGVYGVSFIIVLTNAAIFEGLRLFDPTRVRTATVSLITACLCLTLVWGYGQWQLQRLDQAAVKSAHIGVVQANIPQDIKWDSAFRQETLRRYEQLTHQVAETGVDLVVWPEAAMPFIFEDNRFFKQQVLDIVKREESPLLFGSPARARNRNGNLSLTNSAFLVDSKGNVLSRQDKIHLVPFGEYVPLSPLLFFLDKMVTGIGNFSAGNSYTVMRVPSSSGETRLGVVICFEVIFPDLVRRYVREGTDIMVTITNDAWFGRSSAPYQHFAMVVFRSIENRVPFVRAANTGISGFIEATGEIRLRTDIFSTVAVHDQVRYSGERTFYTKAGNIFSDICGIITFGLILLRIRREKDHPRRNNS